MPTAVQGLGASTAPPSKCPVSPSLQPMTVALGLRDAEVSYDRRPCDYTSQVNRPSSPKSPPTPPHGKYPIPPRSAWGGLRHIWRHPRHRVVPATSGCVLKAEARVGGFCSWLGSGESIQTQIGNRVSVLPLRGDSPTPPAGCWGLESGFPKRTVHSQGQGKTASGYPTVSLARFSGLVQNVLVPEANTGYERFSKEDRGGAK